MIGQQAQPGQAVHHPVRLRGGDRDLIQRRLGRAQAISLHQDIGDARRFEQHAPFRDDNQE